MIRIRLTRWVRIITRIIMIRGFVRETDLTDRDGFCADAIR
jgi:hypothetical protein